MIKREIQEKIIQAVEAVKERNPLVGSITNMVTINLVANAQLAVGGSAAMVYLSEEGEFLAKAGQSMYINMGTLLPVHERALPHVAKVLHDIGTPWVLDPVGVGIGSMRTQLLKQFKELKPNIIRGNASEIIALAGLWGLDGGTAISKARGVDSTDSVMAAKAAAVSLAKWTGGAVAVSGDIDLITDGKLMAYSYGGSNFMPKITGAGCSLGGVMAVYLAVTSPFVAALTGAAVYNLAGTRAEKKADGPGRFQVQFIDELYKVSAEDIANNPFDIEEV